MMEGQYKDSGIEWIGRIPEEWKTCRFKNLHAPANVGESIDKEFCTDNPSDTTFYTAGIKPIHTIFKDFPSWKLTKDEDLLLARNGTPYVYLPLTGAVYSDHIIRTPIKKQANKKYVRYCLQQAIASVVVDTVSIATWSISVWDKQFLTFPSLSMQLRIADYLDEKLRDVKAVQTLSRLNRAHPDKVDTYVLDFVNDPEDIKKSFEPFYTGTELIKPMDLNSVFTLRDNIRELNFWNDQDEQRVEDIVKDLSSVAADCKSAKSQSSRLGKLSNAFKGVVDRIVQLDEDAFYTIRGQIKQFVRFYNYLAQVERTYNRDLYRTYIYCELLLKLLPKKQHDPIDLNKQLMLVNSRIEAGETQSIHLDKNAGGLAATKPGAGSGPDDKRDLLSNIIDKVNMMFRGPFTKEDRVLVESIYDKLNQPKVRKKLTKQARNNDPKQFAESIFPEVFAEAAQECYGDQMEAFRRLFQNHDLYNSIMSQMGEMMYASFRAQDEAVFNPERFKVKVQPVIEAEFAGSRTAQGRGVEIAARLVDLIAARTTDAYDGANDVIQNAFNRLYCSAGKVSLIDRKQHFNTLVSRFEVFLKKVYYLNNHTGIVSTKPGREGMTATLSDCIYQTPCLRRLRHAAGDTDRRFAGYLDMVRDWRNDNAHMAPASDGQEIDTAIRVVTAMYLYVAANNNEAPVVSMPEYNHDSMGETRRVADESQIADDQSDNHSDNHPDKSPMNMNPTKDDMLYLPIKQNYFDEIVAGTKKKEYRDISPTTYKKYLDCDEEGNPYANDEVLSPEDLEYYGADLLMACKDGKFPFYFREDIKFLNLAVGYNKERDTAIVEVESITAQIPNDRNGHQMRFNINADGSPDITPEGKFCMWQAVFQLGKVVELHRKDEDLPV